VTAHLAEQGLRLRRLKKRRGGHERFGAQRLDRLPLPVVAQQPGYLGGDAVGRAFHRVLGQMRVAACRLGAAGRPSNAPITSKLSPGAAAGPAKAWRRSWRRPVLRPAAARMRSEGRCRFTKWPTSQAKVSDGRLIIAGRRHHRVGFDAEASGS
jgi:hypothetical protein